MAEGIKTGDDPAVVAKVIVAAATDPKPRLRYTAGSTRRACQHAAPHRPRPGLRQADPQDQPPGQLTGAARPAMGPGVLSRPPKALASSRGQQLTPGIREGRCHMKAFVVDKYGKDSTLRAQQMPEPEIGGRDALVRIAAAGVNPLDAKIMAGEFRLVLPYKPPFVLGNDLAGVVERVGPGVHRFAPGDEVYARPDTDRIGTFAGLISVSEDDLAPKPAGLTMAQAASLPLVALTAWQALVERADVKPGQKVLIHAGSGGVGTIAIQLAKYLGAYVATTTSTANAGWVRGLGADLVVDYRKQDFEQVVQDYDVVLDSLGGET